MQVAAAKAEEMATIGMTERELEKCILHVQSAYLGGERPMTTKNFYVGRIEERIDHQSHGLRWHSEASQYGFRA